MLLCDPKYFKDFQGWANNICAQNLDTPLPHNHNWKDWASSLLLLNVLPNGVNPHNFKDWKEWATRLVVINSQM